jgi:undecaprenyl diphosphate synthase
VDEVTQLMALFERFLRTERQRCAEENVRVCVIGRRDRLESSLLREIRATEDCTAQGERLTLRIAVDYSSRDLLVRAAEQTPYAASRSCLAGLIAAAAHCDPIPDVDLLIRTGREKRLSDFLLWECAYAELYFTDCMWPDFGAQELRKAVHEYRLRERRFGTIPAIDSSCPVIT